MYYPSFFGKANRIILYDPLAGFPGYRPSLDVDRNQACIDLVFNPSVVFVENRSKITGAGCRSFAFIVVIWLTLSFQVWAQGQREEILLSPNERETLLSKMCQLLEDVSAIANGVVKGDFAKIAEAGARCWAARRCAYAALGAARDSPGLQANRSSDPSHL